MDDSKINVEKWNPANDGTLSAESMRSKLDRQGYRCTQYEFQPGTVFPDHTHSVTKKDAIVSGQFQFAMFGQEIILQPGDLVLVPKDVVHRAAVVGTQPVVFFDSTK